MHSYESALRLAGVSVPPHLVHDAEVPILTGPQAQGDLLVRPADAPVSGEWTLVASDGIQVVHGEESGNTHWLHAGFDSPTVQWMRSTTAVTTESLTADSLVVGYLRVPDGQSALLIHTDEHGANGIGPGTYAVHRKRQSGVTFWARTSFVED